jgi:hypothetical protein
MCYKKREAEKEYVKFIDCINFVSMWTYPMLGGSLVTVARMEETASAL